MTHPLVFIVHCSRSKKINLKISQKACILAFWDFLKLFWTFWESCDKMIE